MEEIAKEVFDWIGVLTDNVSKVVLGKSEPVRLATVGLLMKGHVLLEDVPGVGKTLLAKAMAGSIGASFGRIQFTADLLPADITGSSVFEASSQRFAFRKGPLFVHVLLADELNRASPRTQSSLLEAMNESQVTLDGTTHLLPVPFWVMATQNPIEHEGTYPLPSSQLDRFALSLKLGYPSAEWESQILRQHMAEGVTMPEVAQVITLDQLRTVMDSVSRVHVDPSITDYVVRLVGRTRDSSRFRIGASPRAAILLHRAAMAWALVEGRTYCVPDDIKTMVEPVLSHRVLLSEDRQAMGITLGESLRAALHDVPVPE